MDPFERVLVSILDLNQWSQIKLRLGNVTLRLEIPRAVKEKSREERLNR